MLCLGRALLIATITGRTQLLDMLLRLPYQNVRMFIKYGGILSTREAIYHGLPPVRFPIYGDQRYNVAKIAFFGVGIQLDYENITTKSVILALNEVLNNER